MTNLTITITLNYDADPAHYEDDNPQAMVDDIVDALVGGQLPLDEFSELCHNMEIKGVVDET